jgi:hemolysin activation/secretion protein
MLELADETEALRYGDRSLDRTLSAVEARAQYLVRITSRTRLVPGVLAAGVFTTSGEVPLSHLVRLGGAATLRGYPEDWFATRRVVAASVEVRRLLSEDSRVYAFLDAATLDRAGHTIGDLSRAPFGYGFGFLGRTAAGALRVEIALGRGDSWSRAKLHLALAERF